MYQFLFKNRLVALAFVVLMVLGVRGLIGTESEEGALTRTAASIESKVRSMQSEAREFQAKQNANIVKPETGIVRPEPVATGFVPDEELIDEGEGDEPLPFPHGPLIEGSVVEDMPPDVVNMPPDIVVPEVVERN